MRKSTMTYGSRNPVPPSLRGGQHEASHRRMTSGNFPQRTAPVRTPNPSTVEKYREAVEFYAATELGYREICKHCGVPFHGFRSYIWQCRRDLLLARHGVECPSEVSSQIRLHGKRGQTPAAHAKYKDAIAACDSEEYIEYNVSQIARLFGLNGTALANHLRAHYPEIVPRREQRRRSLGIADNQQRGVRPKCRDEYSEAVELLRTTEMTFPEVVEACGISYGGLRQHLGFYHKDLVEKRCDLREQATGTNRKGHMTGNGRRHAPTPEAHRRYAGAVRLYSETSMTVAAIAESQGVDPNAFKGYLRMWHPELFFARRGAEYREGASLSDTKRYRKDTAAKYAAAIERLRKNDLPTAEVAAKFGLHPYVFRQYLKEHEPELCSRHGMMRAENGRTVSRRSMEKYAEALHLYETTSEGLKSIALRLGLQYASLGGFVRRNFPELIRRHNALTAS